MTRNLYSVTLRNCALHCATVLLLFFACSTLRAQAGLVFFLDDAPADDIVDCYGDLPPATRLRAVVLLGGGAADTILVSPFDSLATADAPCTGGLLFRIWEVEGRINTARETQEIAFDAAPDGSGPTFVTGQLPPARDTVDCVTVNETGHPDSYDRWLGDRRIAAATAAREGCAPLVSVNDNAPDTLINFSCNDTLRVTFVATDLCGRTATLQFVYVTIDTTAPVIAGVVSDTIFLSCTDEVPPVPVVTVTDCDTAVMATFTETSTQTMDGACGQYDYDVERTWTATDGCGFTTIVRQRYEVRDNEAPDFTRPFNVSLTCLEDPFDLNLTGRPTNLSDNCSPLDALIVTFTDEIIGAGACQNSYDVQRTWNVADACGNSRVRVQQIRVRDNLPPNFTPPAATVSASCENYLDTDITGAPFNLADQCDETVNLLFEDVITAGSCANNFTVARRWRIFDDCGNSRFFNQTVVVTDTTAPVFTTAPTDLVTSCNSNRNQEFIFNTWVQDFGGAQFADGCSAVGNLTVRVVETGTQNYPLLPAVSCTEADGTARRLSVDIIVSDECGNSTTTTMQYRQLDEQPINIFDCPESQVTGTDPGECTATVALPPPTIQDQCSSGPPFQLNLRDTVRITSQATNQAELGSVPVDPLVFNLQIPDALPVNGFTTGIFTITLENVDAEGADEFFYIYAEDGTLLGTTNRGTVQCETVVTVDSITPFQFTRYARDGVISFRLEPNIPAGQPGTFAINNLCEGGSIARIHLRQAAFRLTEIVYEVNIDGEGFNRVDPADSLFATLDVGLHQIIYRATDCGGSADECGYTITVEDREPPVVICPEDIELIAPADACQVTIAVPLPQNLTDNCEPYTLVTERAPAGNDVAFFQFRTDPNLNSFQAQPLAISLEDVPANIADSVDLDVYFTGQFSNRGAVLEVLLPDGTVIGRTNVGAANCTTTGVLRLRVAATDLTAQLDAGGRLNLQLRPVPVTVPPGQPGDGITPCDEGSVDENGDTDGISGAYVVATYRTLFFRYFTEGATVTPPGSTSESMPVPTLTFEQGVTSFSYIVSDPGGNADTCSFLVTVRDTTPPVVRCTATTIFVDPSGLSPIMVDPALIGGGSTDNCGIDFMELTPDRFTCDQYGTTPTLRFLARDASGNEDSCTTIVSIAPLPPAPTASTSLCGGDTLRLFANPPTVAAPGQTIYTFQWFDPAGTLISTQQNPVIPGVDESREGAYLVVIRGLTGCEATAIVNVDIGSIPAAPVITAPQRVCIGEDAILTSTSSYAGQIRYEWFRGQPGAGILVGSSPVATFAAPFAEGQNSGDFYAIAYVNGCASPPSNVVTVGTTERPTVNIPEATSTSCELSNVTFSAEGMTTMVYEWTGPNDFSATGQTVTLSNLALENAGTYYVRAIRSEGCFSLPDSIILTVLPASLPTTLMPVASVCPSDTLILQATATDGDRYLFSGPNGLEFDVDEPILRIAPVVPAVAGQWTVRIQRGTCPSAPSPAIIVRLGESPRPRASTIPDPVCEGNDLILQGASNIAGSSYSWRGPNNYSAVGIAPILRSVDSSVSGDYILTVTSPSGCFAEDTIPVTVLPGIVVESINVSSASCLSGGEPVSLTATINPALPEGGNYTYRWTGPEGTSTSDTLRIPNVSLASNGTYTLEVTNQAGCVSPRFSMNVEFNFGPAAPVQPFTNNGVNAICAGDSITLMTNDFGINATYLWRLPDGTNIPTITNTLRLQNLGTQLSGAFTVRVIRLGCISQPSEARMITVTPFPAIMVTADDPACAGQPIHFQATDLPGATYSWRGPGTFSSSLPNPTIVRADPAVHAGTYSVVASIGVCSSDTMSVDVSILPTPGVPVIQPIAPICISDAGSTLSLVVNPNTATEGATYQWFIQGGQVPVGEATTALTLNVTDFGLFAGGGLFDFTVQASLNGCSSASSTPVNIRLDEADANFQPNAGRDTVICAGLYLLDAAPGGAGSGRWSLVEGTGDITIINPTSRTTAVQGLTEFGGPYKFAWTLSNGSCLNYAADTVTLTVTDGEEAIPGEDILACVREEVRLAATPVSMSGSRGRWTQALAQQLLGVVIVSPSDPNTVIQGLQANNIYSFTWTVTSNCGVKAENVLVTVSDPTPYAGMDQTVCTGNRRTTLAADPSTIGSVGRWRSLDPDVTVSEPDNPASPVIGLFPGENLFVWEVDEGFCGDRSRDTVVIDYVEPPQPRDDEFEAPFQGEVTFDPAANDNNPAGATISFASAPAGSTLVDNGDGTFTFRAPANFVGEIGLDYEVLTDGCVTTSATTFILVGKGVDCAPPNIFTPNNDGVNDAFVVPCLLDTDRFPSSEVTIYNQWGDEVYRSGKPYPGNWDGTFQGSALPVATYFYTIDFGDGRESISGSVRIER